MLARRLWGGGVGAAVQVGCQNGAGVRAVLAQQVRHAGGGGRPGGRPTLGWKQKQQLRLANKQSGKTFKLRAFGSVGAKDLEQLLGKDWSKSAVNLSKVTEYQSPDVPTESSERGAFDGENNTRKQINIQSLFGPTKPFGMLEKKENKFHRTFSHKRLREAKLAGGGRGAANNKARAKA